MAFDVYPNQAAPLTLKKAPSAATPTSSGALSITTQRAALYPPFQPPYAQMMFIWVAVTGAVALTGTAAPTFELRVGTGPGTTTPPLSSASTVLQSAPGTRLGDAWVTPLSSAPNVFQIFVGFDNVTTVDWALFIQNNDTTADGQFTWVVADNPTETAQPWVDVVYLDTSTSPPNPVSTRSYQVLTGDHEPDSFRVSNYGTASFDVTALSPALPGGFALDTTLPLTVPSGARSALTVSFTAPSAPPPPDGVTTPAPALTPNPPDSTAIHNRQFTVKARTEQLEVVLLLDDSGSMSWDPDGTVLPAGSTSARWHELRDASSNFLDLLVFSGRGPGSGGVAGSPPSARPNPSPFNIETLKPIPSDMKPTKDK